MRRWILIGITAIALGLTSLGAFLIYAPAGFIVLGLLIWIDLNLAFRRERAE